MESQISSDVIVNLLAGFIQFLLHDFLVIVYQYLFDVVLGHIGLEFFVEKGFLELYTLLLLVWVKGKHWLVSIFEFAVCLTNHILGFVFELFWDHDHHDWRFSFSTLSHAKVSTCYTLSLTSYFFEVILYSSVAYFISIIQQKDLFLNLFGSKGIFPVVFEVSSLQLLVLT